MRVTATRTITVSASSINPTLSISPTSGYVGTGFTLYVTVPGNAIPPIGVTVNWGDGTTSYATVTIPSSTTSIGKTYSSAKTYTITVSLSDAAGQSGSASLSVQVVDKLAASLTSDKTSGTVPLTVTFTGSISGGYTPYSWILDYGDGTTPDTGSTASVSKTHTYNKTGTFTATLTATDALGGAALSEVLIGAGVTPVPPVSIALMLIPIALGTILVVSART